MPVNRDKTTLGLSWVGLDQCAGKQRAASSMINTATFLIFCVFLVVFGLYNRVKKTRRLSERLPGPSVLPLLDNFLTLGSLSPVPHYAWDSLTSQYGKIVRVVLGQTVLVILGGLDQIKAAMNNQDLDDRAGLPTANLIRFGSDTAEEISFFQRAKIPKTAKISPIEKWRELRRFTLKSLRDLGLGKTASEEAIIEESKVLLQSVENVLGGKQEGIIDMEKSLNFAALNIIWYLTAGQRFTYEDPKMQKLVNFAGEFMGLAKEVLTKPFGAFPLLRFIPPYREIFNKLSQSQLEFAAWVGDTIEEHRQSLDPENPRDLIDMFLIEAEKDEREIYTESQLISICNDLFIAGSETTSNSLQFAIAVLVRYPDVQAEVQSHLDRIEADVIRMEHKASLGYVEATLNEIWRFCNVAPFGPPRYAHSDVKINETVIPAGSSVMYNTFTLHNDKDHWGDPELFRPERFMRGDTFVPDEMLNPFGIGRRKCLGETLARMENFIFFANLMKRFRFEKIGEEPPSLEPNVGFTNRPFSFKTKIFIR